MILRVFVSFLFTSLCISCSQKGITLIKIAKPVESKAMISDSVQFRLQGTQENWQNTANGYYVRKESYNPSLVSHYFVMMDDHGLKYSAFEQSPATKAYSILEARFTKQAWHTIDSLVTDFWNKPQEIPKKIGVLDGGRTEMFGIRNYNKHKVFCSNPSIQDPEFDSIAKIISLHLYGNALSTH